MSPFFFFLFYCFSHFEDIHIIIIKKRVFHKNRNKQIQVYKLQQHLQLETGKTCEACSIVHWEGTCRRP